MKKLNNKKGFTIVELVIVIAVIGILAGVLIPTFSNVTKNAKETAAMEEAKNSLTAVLTAAKGSIASDAKFIVDGTYVFTYKDGALQTVSNTENTILAGNYIMYVNYSKNDRLVELDDTNSFTKKLTTSGQELISKALAKLGITATFTGESVNATVEDGSADKAPIIKVGSENTSSYTFTLYVSSDVTKSTVVVIPD